MPQYLFVKLNGEDCVIDKRLWREELREYIKLEEAKREFLIDYYEPDPEPEPYDEWLSQLKKTSIYKQSLFEEKFARYTYNLDEPNMLKYKKKLEQLLLEDLDEIMERAREEEDFEYECMGDDFEVKTLRGEEAVLLRAETCKQIKTWLDDNVSIVRGLKLN